MFLTRERGKRGHFYGEMNMMSALRKKGDMAFPRFCRGSNKAVNQLEMRKPCSATLFL